MRNYITKISEFLATAVIFFCLFFVADFPVSAKSDWTKPLKRCWTIDNSDGYRFASDNDKPKSIIFSKEKIKLLNPKNGDIFWENITGGNLEHQPLFFGDSILFLTSNTLLETKTLNSIDLASGLFNWRKEILFAERLFESKSHEKLYVIDKDMKLLQVNRNNGETDWTINFRNEILSVSTLADEILVTTTDGVISAISRNGTKIDVAKYTNDLSKILNIDRRLFVWTDKNNNTGTFDTNIGKNLWQRKIGGQISDLRLFKDTVFISSLDNFIYLFDIKSGNLLLKKRLDGRVTNSSSVSNNIIAVSAYNSFLIYLVDLEERKVVNILSLSDADVFAESFGFVEDRLIVTTPVKIISFSPVCQ